MAKSIWHKFHAKWKSQYHLALVQSLEIIMMHKPDQASQNLHFCVPSYLITWIWFHLTSNTLHMIVWYVWKSTLEQRGNKPRNLSHVQFLYSFPKWLKAKCIEGHSKASGCTCLVLRTKTSWLVKQTRLEHTISYPKKSTFEHASSHLGYLIKPLSFSHLSVPPPSL